MAKNKVQFQKGLSISDFLSSYGTEDQCRVAVFSWRWPKEFACPECGWNHYCEIKGRKVLQCNRCHHQTSLIAGTIFQDTKLGLTKWFLAIYLITQNKVGISSLALARQLGVSQNTSWRVKHKLMQVMLERDNGKQLKNRIEIDDAYLGGERHGGKRGRGADGKTPFLAAVETTDNSEPIRIKLSVVKGFRKEIVRRWSALHLSAGCSVVSDGLLCFGAIAESGCKHQAVVVGGGAKSVSHPEFNWVNTTLGNIKGAIVGTYRAISGKHAARYLAEFEYRHNRRFRMADMIPRLGYVGAHTPPMPERLLKLAEIPW
ncbi:MAG: IS1595 family transposase [SAR324 cluster bacterium]|nr:IS1595 family transposase [SAR324 cluster bacterium]MBF0353510.1 IS1595 family transposase [SAR324 cluster bacterium]